MSGTHSTNALLKELIDFCNSGSLSENGLREIFERYGCENNNLKIDDYDFFIVACHNERVTEEILRCLLEYFPDAVSVTSSEELTSLHYICFNKNATLGMVQLIIDSCPESIDKATNNGRTPLHFLCCNENLDASIKLDILGLVVEVCSEAAQHADDDGYTLLHVICNNKNTTLGMVQLLIDAYPESIDRANNAGGTPLRFLCANNEIEDNTAVGILGLLLERCPEAARRAETSGALPIHVACGVGFKSPEFCRMLIEAYPGSERIAAMGVLPLHIACTLGSVAVAEYLLKLYPESINVADSDGAYPIHKAIIRVNSETPTIASEMVQMLLNCDPNVASQKPRGRGEFTPLYLVCSISTLFRGDDGVATSRVNAAFKIAQLLYDAYPEAIENNNLSSIINMFPEEIQAFINTQLTYACQARNTRQMNTPDVNGQLPLHRAIRDNVTLGSIKLLLKRNPLALLIPDNSGALPLHVAIQHHDSTKVVDYLVGLDPNTLTAVDREGNTALHYACHGAKYDTITLLLEKYDAVSVSQSNALNKLPIHLLFESDVFTEREDDTKYLESVFQLVRANPETVMVSEDVKQASLPRGGRPSRIGKKRKYCA